MKKLRIGFVGAGGMADAHLKGLVAPAFEDIEIVAFCDAVLERAQEKAKPYDAAAYSTPPEMIKDAGLDACYILLPPFCHGEAERACIEANVPFLVEKPPGNDIGLLRELRDEIAQRGLMTAVGYMNRYQPSVQRAKQMFSTDEAVVAYGGWFGGPPKAGRTALIGQWWPVKEKSGGQMVEQVTHTVDLVRYFLGDAVEVFAHTTTAFNHKLADLATNYTIDDAMTTSIKFANGAIATILASAATPVGGGVFLDILGTHTAVKFTGWGHDAKIVTKGESGNVEETVASEGAIFPVEDRAFLDAVRTGDRAKILTDYADAYKTSQITLGANKSAATGKPVELPND